MDWASVTEAVDKGSIPGRVKPKTIKIGIHSFPAWRSAIKRNNEKPPPCVVDRWAGWQLEAKDRKVPSLFPGQGTCWIKCNYNKNYNLGRKNFCSVFSQKFLTDLKTNFIKFKLYTTFRFQDGNLDFPFKVLPGLPATNKISKSSAVFVTLNMCLR